MAKVSAYDKARKQLADWGIGELADDVIKLSKQGLGDAEFLLELRKTESYTTRFAGNEMRRKKGLPVLSEDQYLSKEAEIRSAMGPDGYGLPKGFYDQPDDFAKAIGADLGGAEMRRRLEARKKVVMDGANTGVLAYAKEKYGLSDGDLIAYFIDPARAAPLLEKIANASQIGAAGKRVGFGAVAKADAERLAALGVTADQAAAGYSQAAELRGLEQEIAGTDSGQLSRGDLARATLEDDAEARRKIARRQEERKARFSGGGSYAEGQGGVTGLGSANRR